GQTGDLPTALARLAEDDPDADLAGAIRTSGKVLLPIAFAFSGEAQPAPPALAPHDYQRLDQRVREPGVPPQPLAAILPLAAFVDASAGLGHVNIAYDEDGSPRYDHLALPYDGDFVPSLAVRAAAAYLGVPWNEVGLALGDGVRLGASQIPTD